jgi:hypothetical protein
VALLLVEWWGGSGGGGSGLRCCPGAPERVGYVDSPC